MTPRRARRATQFARRRRVLPDAARRASCRRGTSTTRSARRCSRRSAELPWYRDHAGRARAARARTAAEISGARRRAVSTHRRARAGQRREARDARSAARRRRARLAVHLVDVSAAALDTRRRARSARSTRLRVDRASGDLRERPRRARRRAAAADGRRWSLFLGSNIGNFDPPAPTRSCAASARRSRRATRCCSAPIS